MLSKDISKNSSLSHPEREGEGLRVVILGSGESGIGSAILAQSKGFSVFVSDKGLIQDNYKAELQKHNIEFEEGIHTEDLIFNATEI